MDLRDRIARVRDLFEQREKIDAELTVFFGITDQPKTWQTAQVIRAGLPAPAPGPAQ